MNILRLFVLLFVLTPVFADIDHQPWNELLKSYVHTDARGLSSAVDYRGMRLEAQKLDNYLRQLSQVSTEQFSQWSPAEKLAYLINAYNAWTVQLILSSDPNTQSIKDLGNWLRTPWQKSFIPLLQKTRSLDDIEHRLIRADAALFDPRVHFALNCASKGCPALRAEAYRADMLEQQLEEQTRRFLSDGTRNRFSGEQLHLSPIFKWYAKDFDVAWRDSYGLANFLSRYSAVFRFKDARTFLAQFKRASISYTEYDWSLNNVDVALR